MEQIEAQSRVAPDAGSQQRGPRVWGMIAIARLHPGMDLDGEATILSHCQQVVKHVILKSTEGALRCIFRTRRTPLA